MKALTVSQALKNSVDQRIDSGAYDTQETFNASVKAFKEEFGLSVSQAIRTWCEVAKTLPSKDLV